MQGTTNPNKAFWEAATLVAILLLLLFVSLWSFGGGIWDGEKASSPQPNPTAPNRAQTPSSTTPPGPSTSQTPEASGPSGRAPPGRPPTPRGDDESDSDNDDGGDGHDRINLNMGRDSAGVHFQSGSSGTTVQVRKTGGGETSQQQRGNQVSQGPQGTAGIPFNGPQTPPPATYGDEKARLAAEEKRRSDRAFEAGLHSFHRSLDPTDPRHPDFRPAQGQTTALRVDIEYDNPPPAYPSQDLGSLLGLVDEKKASGIDSNGEEIVRPGDVTVAGPLSKQPITQAQIKDGLKIEVDGKVFDLEELSPVDTPVGLTEEEKVQRTVRVNVDGREVEVTGTDGVPLAVKEGKLLTASDGKPLTHPDGKPVGLHVKIKTSANGDVRSGEGAKVLDPAKKVKKDRVAFGDEPASASLGEREKEPIRCTRPSCDKTFWYHREFEQRVMDHRRVEDKDAAARLEAAEKEKQMSSEESGRKIDAKRDTRRERTDGDPSRSKTREPASPGSASEVEEVTVVDRDGKKHRILRKVKRKGPEASGSADEELAVNKEDPKAVGTREKARRKGSDSNKETSVEVVVDEDGKKHTVRTKVKNKRPETVEDEEAEVETGSKRRVKKKARDGNEREERLEDLDDKEAVASAQARHSAGREAQRRAALDNGEDNLHDLSAGRRRDGERLRDRRRDDVLDGVPSTQESPNRADPIANPPQPIQQPFQPIQQPLQPIQQPLQPAQQPLQPVQQQLPPVQQQSQLPPPTSQQVNVLPQQASAPGGQSLVQPVAMPTQPAYQQGPLQSGNDGNQFQRLAAHESIRGQQVEEDVKEGKGNRVRNLLTPAPANKDEAESDTLGEEKEDAATDRKRGSKKKSKALGLLEAESEDSSLVKGAEAKSPVKAETEEPPLEQISDLPTPAKKGFTEDVPRIKENASPLSPIPSPATKYAMLSERDQELHRMMRKADGELPADDDEASDEEVTAKSLTSDPKDSLGIEDAAPPPQTEMIRRPGPKETQIAEQGRGDMDEEDSDGEISPIQGSRRQDWEEDAPQAPKRLEGVTRHLLEAAPGPQPMPWENSEEPVAISEKGGRKRRMQTAPTDREAQEELSLPEPQTPRRSTESPNAAVNETTTPIGTAQRKRTTESAPIDLGAQKSSEATEQRGPSLENPPKEDEFISATAHRDTTSESDSEVARVGGHDVESPSETRMIEQPSEAVKTTPADDDVESSAGAWESERRDKVNNKPITGMAAVGDSVEPLRTQGYETKPDDKLAVVLGDASSSSAAVWDQEREDNLPSPGQGEQLKKEKARAVKVKPGSSRDDALADASVKMKNQEPAQDRSSSGSFSGIPQPDKQKSYGKFSPVHAEDDTISDDLLPSPDTLSRLTDKARPEFSNPARQQQPVSEDYDRSLSPESRYRSTTDAPSELSQSPNRQRGGESDPATSHRIVNVLSDDLPSPEPADQTGSVGFQATDQAVATDSVGANSKPGPNSPDSGYGSEASRPVSPLPGNDVPANSVGAKSKHLGKGNAAKYSHDRDRKPEGSLDSPIRPFQDRQTTKRSDLDPQQITANAALLASPAADTDPQSNTDSEAARTWKDSKPDWSFDGLPSDEEKSTQGSKQPPAAESKPLPPRKPPVRKARLGTGDLPPAMDGDARQDPEKEVPLPVNKVLNAELDDTAAAWDDEPSQGGGIKQEVPQPPKKTNVDSDALKRTGDAAQDTESTEGLKAKVLPGTEGQKGALSPVSEKSKAPHGPDDPSVTRDEKTSAAWGEELKKASEGDLSKDGTSKPPKTNVAADAVDKASLRKESTGDTIPLAGKDLSGMSPAEDQDKSRKMDDKGDSAVPTGQVKSDKGDKVEGTKVDPSNKKDTNGDTGKPARKNQEDDGNDSDDSAKTAVDGHGIDKAASGDDDEKTEKQGEVTPDEEKRPKRRGGASSGDEKAEQETRSRERKRKKPIGVTRHEARGPQVVDPDQLLPGGDPVASPTAKVYPSGPRQESMGPRQIFRSTRHVIAHAPVWSFFTATATAVFILGDRQLAQLVINSNTTSPPVEKRAEAPDLILTDDLSKELASGLSPTEFFFLLNIWNVLGVLIISLLVSGTISHSHKTTDRKWTFSLGGSAHSIAKLIDGVSNVLLMGAKASSIGTFLCPFSFRRYARLFLFLLQLVVSVFVLQQSVLLAFEAANTSNTLLDSTPDPGGLGDLAQSLSPLQILVALNALLAVVIFSLTFGWFALLNPAPTKARSVDLGPRAHNSPRSATTVLALKSIGAIIILTVFLGVMYFFAEISTYASADSDQNQANSNIILANVILLIFTPALGWSLIVLSQMVRKFYRSFMRSCWG